MQSYMADNGQYAWNKVESDVADAIKEAELVARVKESMAATQLAATQLAAMSLS